MTTTTTTATEETAEGAVRARRREYNRAYYRAHRDTLRQSDTLRQKRRGERPVRAMASCRRHDYTRVLELRMTGMTVREIGRELGMASANVQYAIQTELCRRGMRLVKRVTYELQPAGVSVP